MTARSNRGERPALPTPPARLGTHPQGQLPAHPCEPLSWPEPRSVTHPGPASGPPSSRVREPLGLVLAAGSCYRCVTLHPLERGWHGGSLRMPRRLPWAGKPVAWTGGLVALGLGLRVYHYARNPSMWHDEAALVLNVLSKGFHELLGPLLFAEASPPP